MKENLNFVLVGHIDHGKSTLIGRLFYDTESLSQMDLEDAKSEDGEIKFARVMDHLTEERDRGITIDTAQTFFSTDKRNYTIIDAPGHKEFIKNMITGASQAEAGILVVDADEGVMPQTKRHAYILSLIGIDQVVVAMNKMDLVDYSEERYEEVKEELNDFLGSIGIEPNYIIPISAKEGDNVAENSERMPWYGGITILDALDTFEAMPAPVEKPLRFPVQDVYEMDGQKIHAGRVESGAVEEGQEVLLFPGKKKTRVKEINKFDEDASKAGAGESIGLVIEKGELERGNLISGVEEPPKEKNKLNANLFWLSPQEFSKNETNIFRCNTQEVNASLDKIDNRLDSSTLEVKEEDAEKLKEHEVGEITLEMDEPVFVDDFNQISETGRFVIEKDGRISGGGIILGD